MPNATFLIERTGEPGNFGQQIKGFTYPVPPSYIAGLLAEELGITAEDLEKFDTVIRYNPDTDHFDFKGTLKA